MRKELIPGGRMCSPVETRTLQAHRDDWEAADLRRRIREKLLEGRTVTVSPQGGIEENGTSSEQEGIVIPPGKLAFPLSFYWYENSPQTLISEKHAMEHFFPSFSLGKLDDGRLFWLGDFISNMTKQKWVLQAIYDHDHPSNKNYGGSVKVYTVIPQLEEISEEMGGEPIPHTLCDGEGNMYLCTARTEDIKVGRTNYTAASALAFAAKWIAAFELWSLGELSDSEFCEHRI